jgi:hypothetical protein
MATCRTETDNIGMDLKKKFKDLYLYGLNWSGSGWTSMMYVCVDGIETSDSATRDLM